MSKDARARTLGIRCTDAELGRWQAAAEAQGVTASEWARGLLDGHALEGMAGPAVDQDVEAAAELLRETYFLRTAADAVRLAVLACAQQLERGRDPLRIARGEPLEAPYNPEAKKGRKP